MLDWFISELLGSNQTSPLEDFMIIEKDLTIPTDSLIRGGETKDILSLKITAKSSDIKLIRISLKWPLTQKWGVKINLYHKISLHSFN